eukprot:3411281-Amphidinium_carterae.2
MLRLCMCNFFGSHRSHLVRHGGFGGCARANHTGGRLQIELAECCGQPLSSVITTKTWNQTSFQS